MHRGTTAHSINTQRHSVSPASARVRLVISKPLSHVCVTRSARALFLVGLQIFLFSRVGWAQSSSANERSPTYDVQAAIDADRRTISMSIDASHVPVSSGTLRIWLYADRLRRVPPSFDDLTADRIFPENTSFGGYKTVSVTVQGCDPQTIDLNQSQPDVLRGRILTLSVCANAVIPAHVTVQAQLELADRYGTLGRSPDETALGDPWYPLFLPPNADRPAPATHYVRLVSSNEKTLVSAAGAVRGKSLSVTQDSVSHVPVFVLDSGHIRSQVERGVLVTYVTRRAAVPITHDTNGFLSGSDPFDPDSARKIQGTVQSAIEMMRRLGFVASPVETPRTMPAQLTLVETSERQRLGVALPGMVAVSDRAFRLIPIERIERFHRNALLRPIFSALISPHVRSIESADDEGWVADFDGSLLADMHSLDKAEAKESAKDLVGFAGFHPAVDQLLYAPQVAFRSAYFHEVDEPDPDRDGALRALNKKPFGHLMLEKTRDLLEKDKFSIAAKEHLFSARSWRQTVKQLTGDSQQWFFDQWLSRRRKVAYKLVSVSSEKSASNNGYSNKIVVQRLGETDLREPVIVELTDSDNHKLRTKWDSSGALGEIEVISKAKVYDVVIDPEGRLTQDPSLSDNHPRFDDEYRHAWRPPVFSSFAFGASILEGQPDLEIDFIMKRRYDVRHGFGLRVAQTYRGTSASVRYIRGIGDMRDLNNVNRSLVFALGGLYSTTGYGGSTESVTSVSTGASFVQDTRKQAYHPSQGQSLSVSTSFGLAHSESEGIIPTLSLSFRSQTLFWPSLSHTLAWTSGGAVIRCPVLPQSLAVLSGRQGFRGYEIDELLGCSDIYTMLEDRWTILKGLYVNTADLAWGRRLDLVPFVGMGFLASRKTAADLFSRPIFDAGLGLRAIYDYVGVQPGILALDIGYPISRTDRCARDTTGKCLRYRQPLGFYLSFEQTF